MFPSVGQNTSADDDSPVASWLRIAKAQTKAAVMNEERNMNIIVEKSDGKECESEIVDLKDKLKSVISWRGGSLRSDERMGRKEVGRRSRYERKIGWWPRVASCASYMPVSSEGGCFATCALTVNCGIDSLDTIKLSHSIYISDYEAPDRAVGVLIKTRRSVVGRFMREGRNLLVLPYQNGAKRG